MRPGFLLGEVANGLRRNVSMVVSVVLVTMVSLFFLGIGLLAQQQVDTAKGYWYDKVQVSIFLCTPDSTDVASCAAGAVTPEQREQIAADLEGLEPLVTQVYYESNQDAYDRFREQFRNSPVLDTIPQEAIPESFRVNLSDPSKYEVIRQAFEQAPGVESVEDQREVVDKLFTFLGVLSIGALALAVAMVGCAVLLISTAIRLTAWSRRRETAIKRMVGASAFSIYLPFVLETVVATLVGAALALGLLWATVRFGITGFLSELLAGQSGLISLVGERDLWLITPFLVGGALLLAVLTAWAALRRHVRV
ncbi:permease-like cell division protein FtsX [Ornithinimicrobium tianjinense]|uniref:Cell division protein FtsX n=1 Tax=Ornithinimicrobium tianjinense TaxID=1195761 RepID=A0A917BLE8_9MICO|nr:permease-like cell division protein FtsX [Ornithinimicrobium tianjinense]GGF50801.1 cell division protein FtsX [Ornithinimicrobium tianjinense]